MIVRNADGSLTQSEIQMLHEVRARADALAQAVKQATEAGFTVRFNVNGVTGACDVFDVFKMVPVDLRGAAN